jgi:type II secretion system protein G
MIRGDQMLMRTKDRFGEPLRGRRPALRTHRRNDAGYTLLELLVVMGILAVLIAVATPQLMGYFGKAKTQSVQLQIENIGTALELYYMENGSYPSASVGLKALVEATPEAPRWNGPYLKEGIPMTRTGITRRLAALALATVCLLPIAPVRADVVTDWNVIALNATAVPPNSILQSRALAIVHGAIYDAVRAVDRKGGAYAIDVEAPAGTSVDAAVVSAAHGSLVRLAPAERQMLDAALNVSLSKIADGQGKTEGTALGQQIAEKLVALRSTDGAAVKVVFTAKPGVGLYQFTLPHSLPAILAQWGSVTPFVLRSSAGLDLKGAPALTAAQFARDFEEVRSVGARNSTTRTADQTAAAIFWTVQTAVPWHAAARAASAAKGLSLSENARLFALLSMASADSQIIAFAEKYNRPHWRPITAIRAATDLNIAALKGDIGWEPLLVTPPHPEYPSAHAMFSGAAEAVLRGFFGDDQVDVSVTAPGPFGVTRTYHKFSELTEEVDNARVWGGIHFRSADVDGSEIGRKIGEIILREFANSPRKTTQLGERP